MGLLSIDNYLFSLVDITLFLSFFSFTKSINQATTQCRILTIMSDTSRRVPNPDT